MVIVIITAINDVMAIIMINILILVYFIINFDFITLTFNYFTDFNS